MTLPCRLAVFAVLCLVVPAAAQSQPFTVDVLNATTPTQCAEEDNVYFKLFSPIVGRFSVEVLQPAYMGHVTVDVTAPDFTHCVISESHDFAFQPKQVVLHEDRDIVIRGFTFAKFWRQAEIPTTIAGKVTNGLHLIQVFSKRGGGKPFEFLVLYPPDGYWRARPRPLPGFKENVYGSSFLIGPIEDKGRPLADVAAVEILPRERLFKLTFKAGGSATLHFGEPDRRRLALDVTIDRNGMDGSLPFAGLRSMYVNETNADAARVVWKAEPAGPVFGREIPRFSRELVSDIRFDRINPSVHNTSAPDIRFWNFGK